MTTATISQPRESEEYRTSRKILSQVSGFIPTTGLVLKIALSMPVFSQRPVLLTQAQ